jgi:CHASE3 domain sensor protein
MPYHKDKQQAFQAAQQGTKQTMDTYNQIVKNDPDYGHHLKDLREEVQEAYEQIQNALATASETQRQQLEQYEQNVQQIMKSINDEQ